MLRYLHFQAAPLINNTAYRMLQFGDYHLLPNQADPAIVPALEHRLLELALQDGTLNNP